MLIQSYTLINNLQIGMELEPSQEVQQASTTQYQQVMTQQFTKAYNQALKFSKLQLGQEIKHRNIVIYQNQHIHQIYTINPNKPHLVLLHGFGATSLCFIRTFQHLKHRFQIHALDTFGVGLSSRGKWRQKMTPEQTNLYFIEAIEQWRKAMGIKSFILSGHSFGGYIGAMYYQKYPQRVDQLLFLSPGGSGQISKQTLKSRRDQQKIFFYFAEKLYNFSLRPSKLMSFFYFGSKFLDSVLHNKFKLSEEEKIHWRIYFKEITKQQKNSEAGFYKLLKWPLQPLPERSIQQVFRRMNPKIKIDFFFGDDDWMPPQGGERLAKDFPNVKIHFIQKAGHHMLFDNPLLVTQKMNQCLQ